MQTNKFFLVIVIGLVTQMIFAQCPPGSEELIFLKSQEQVDSLLLDYPDCTEILTLEIQLHRDDIGTPIHDLTPLSQLEELTVFKLFSREEDDAMPPLENLNGLHNIRKIRSLQIDYLRHVENLEEIGNINNLEKMTIKNSDNLSELRIDSKELVSLNLFNLPKLESVNALELADEMQLLRLDRLPSLDLNNNFNNLIKVDDLHLNHHDISFVSNIAEIGSLYVHGNGPVQNLINFESINKITISITLESLQELNNLGTFRNVVFPRNLGHLHLYDNPQLQNISIDFNSKEILSLHIRNSPLLTDISAFQSIEKSAIMLISNTGLQEMSGFGNLESVQGYLGLHNNKRLLTLSGLKNLTNLGLQLSITGNENLNDLEGLNNLTKMNEGNSGGFINISSNHSLNSISALSNLFANLGSLTIHDNPELPVCHVQFICDHLLEGQDATISDNGPGCANIKEVEDQCNYPVFQKIFFDQNENGDLDDEPALSLGHTIYNDTYRIFPNNNGVINLSPFDGTIDLVYMPDNNWITTTEDEYAFPNSENVDPMFIGLSPINEINDVSVSIAYEPIVCSQDYNAILTVHNNGTTIIDTEITLQGIGLYVSSTLEPTLIDSSTILLEIFDLLPGQTTEIRLLYFAPNITDVPLGTVLSHNLNYQVYNQLDELVIDNEKNYEQELLCAYDPNDKQVFPSGIGEEKLTLKTEELEYLIRFQNTGNYYAEDIVIRDTLNENLDLNSFKFISASHPISEIRMERNALAFVFENIFLPDSIRNEPDSHGFVSYSIKANSDIAEGIVIDNTAHIYFDSNPAIVTNTVESKMVTTLNDNTSTIDIETSQLKIFPVPASEWITIIGNQVIGEWKIMDIQGRVVLSNYTNQQQIKIETDMLDQGVYFLNTNSGSTKFLAK